MLISASLKKTVSIFLIFPGLCFGKDYNEDFWKAAYEGKGLEFQLLVNLQKSPVSDNRYLLNCLACAYLNYRNNRFKEMEKVFQGIDRFIEQTYLK